MRKAIARNAASFLLAALLLGAPAGAKAFSLGGLFGSPVDAELYAQVPGDQRAPVNDADYALACANQDLELAKLKEELADRQSDLASQSTKLAKAQAKAAQLDLDMAKMQAIVANKLGKAEDTAKILAELKADRVKNAAEQDEIKAKIFQANNFVRDWTRRVADKEKSVASFKARRGGDSAKAPAARADASAPAAPTAQAAPGSNAIIITNEAPAPVEQPKATPEADLKN